MCTSADEGKCDWFENYESPPKSGPCFREKRHEHRQFYAEKHGDFKQQPPPSLSRKTERSVDDIIAEKEGKPSDLTDIVAIEKKIGKKVVVDTYDENGKLVKTSETPGGGGGKDTIRLKNVRVKNADGSFSGHFELVDGGRVSYNDGRDNTCLYQAVCQAQNKANGINRYCMYRGGVIAWVKGTVHILF